MEGGGAHLGSLLPMSVFHRRQSFSCAGGRPRLQALFSFMGVIFVHGGSPWFVGGCLHSCSWAFTFVHGRASLSMGSRLHSWVFVFVGGRPPSFMGGHAICVVLWWAFVFICGWSSSWVVMPLVRRSGGELVGCGGGELVGCGGQLLVCGAGGSSWPFVVV